ncbi:MAG: 2-amino-4-hydroxy-6-hydroxymethyldihydropteridine diphosphokinase [Pontimonas sp.]
MSDDTWVSCVVALGTNLGDREDIAFRALADIAATEGFRVTGSSSLHETVALGPDGLNPDAPAYVNQVIALESAWSVEKTLALLLDIERRHGRERTGEKYADRTLDLDLIVYGDLRHEGPDVTTPHPRAHERRFVLEPWHEINPDAVLPGKGAVSDLLADLPPAD